MFDHNTDHTMTRDEIIDMFIVADGLRVNFTKKNGEIRVMNATRILECIPSEHRPKDFNMALEPNLDVIRAFDVDAQGWRSFRVDSVIDIDAVFALPTVP